MDSPSSHLCLRAGCESFGKTLNMKLCFPCLFRPLTTTYSPVKRPATRKRRSGLRRWSYGEACCLTSRLLAVGVAFKCRVLPPRYGKLSREIQTLSARRSSAAFALPPPFPFPFSSLFCAGRRSDCSAPTSLSTTSPCPPNSPFASSYLSPSSSLSPRPSSPHFRPCKRVMEQQKHCPSLLPCRRSLCRSSTRRLVPS